MGEITLGTLGHTRHPRHPRDSDDANSNPTSDDEPLNTTKYEDEKEFRDIQTQTEPEINSQTSQTNTAITHARETQTARETAREIETQTETPQTQTSQTNTAITRTTETTERRTVEVASQTEAETTMSIIERIPGPAGGPTAAEEVLSRHMLSSTAVIIRGGVHLQGFATPNFQNDYSFRNVVNTLRLPLREYLSVRAYPDPVSLRNEKQTELSL